MKVRAVTWACIAAWWALALIVAGCTEDSSEPGQTNSQTHWLTPCEATVDCQGNFSCFCGRCTVTCNAPDTCEAIDAEAVCAPPFGQQVQAACDEASTSIASNAGICLPPDEMSQETGCGGIAGLACPSGQYCHWDTSQTCGAADALGVCRDIPEECTQEFAPVCGCDGQTYSNACTAAGAGVSIISTGECGQGDQTCGGLAGLQCPGGQFCDYAPGDRCGATDATGVCRDIPTACDLQFDPVCGCDGQTYSNACTANAAGISVLSEGHCEGSSDTVCGGFPGTPCPGGQFCDYALGDQCGAADASGLCHDIPETCTEEFDPVCGCDGQTYSNTCMANAAGTGILATSACQGEQCGGFAGIQCPDGQFCNYALNDFCGAADATGACTDIPEACTQEIAPVCGCDRQTYDNACLANAAGTAVSAEGACQ